MECIHATQHDPCLSSWCAFASVQLGNDDIGEGPAGLAAWACGDHTRRDVLGTRLPPPGVGVRAALRSFGGTPMLWSGRGMQISLCRVGAAAIHGRTGEIIARVWVTELVNSIEV